MLYEAAYKSLLFKDFQQRDSIHELMLKESVDLRIDAVDDRAQVLGLVPEIQIVHIDDLQFAQIVGLYPGFVTFIQILFSSSGHPCEPYVNSPSAQA